MWLEHLTHLWGAHLALVHGLGLLHAVHAVLKVRSPQGAIGWALALASFPYAAVPLYWVFGRSKFIDYRHARPEADTSLDRVAAQAFAALTSLRADLLPDAPSATLRHSLTLFPATRGNTVTVLRDGAETFPALFDAIEHAERYLLVQFFIVRDDRLVRELVQRLAARAGPKYSRPNRFGGQARYAWDGCWTHPQLDRQHAGGKPEISRAGAADRHASPTRARRLQPRVARATPARAMASSPELSRRLPHPAVISTTVPGCPPCPAHRRPR